MSHPSNFDIPPKIGLLPQSCWKLPPLMALGCSYASQRCTCSEMQRERRPSVSMFSRRTWNAGCCNISVCEAIIYLFEAIHRYVLAAHAHTPGYHCYRGILTPSTSIYLSSGDEAGLDTLSLRDSGGDISHSQQAASNGALRTSVHLFNGLVR